MSHKHPQTSPCGHEMVPGGLGISSMEEGKHQFEGDDLALENISEDFKNSGRGESDVEQGDFG